MSVDAIISAIDAEHKARCQAARDAYEVEIAPARRTWQAAQRLADDRERGELAAAAKWRAGAIKAACPGRAVTVSDIQSVSRRTVEGAKLVSVARVACLDGQSQISGVSRSDGCGEMA